MADLTALKGLIPDELFSQLDTTLKESKVKLADLSGGAYVAKEKFEAAETAKKAVETQIAEANKQIEAFKGMNVDEIKAQAEKYKSDYEKATTEHQAALNSLKLEHALDGKLTGEKAKNLKAVKALLNMDNIKLDGDNLIGFDEQFKAVKEANAFLFDTAEPDKTPHFTTGNSNPPAAGGIDAVLRASMGLPTK